MRGFVGTFFAINLVQISVFCLTADEIEAERSGWNSDPNTQYHIQTDEGPERFFRFQTLNGQYRKEKRLADGTVIGTEGWLDPLGYLRIKDYIADGQGYRILKSKMVFVGKEKPIDEAVSVSKKVAIQSGILSRPRNPPNPFRSGDVSSNSIEVNTVSPVRNYAPTVSTPGPVSVDYNEYITPTTLRPRPFSITTSPSLYSSHDNSDDDLQSNLNYLSPAKYGYRNNYVPSVYRTSSFPYRLSRPSLVIRPSYSKRQTNRQKTRRFTNSHTGVASRRQANADAPEYDGHHSTGDGFQYYLKSHYHEQKRQPEDNSNVGSFGYIDPFGIRRIIYYKSDGNGFVHKHNNRYVGHNAEPYDTSPDPRRIERKN